MERKRDRKIHEYLHQPVNGDNTREIVDGDDLLACLVVRLCNDLLSTARREEDLTLVSGRSAV